MKKVLCLILSVAFTVMLTSCKPTLSSVGGDLIKPENRVSEENAIAFFEDKNPIKEISVKFKYERSFDEDSEMKKETSYAKWSGEAYFSSFEFDDFRVGDNEFRCKFSGKSKYNTILQIVNGKQLRYYRKTTEKYTFCKTESGAKEKINRIYKTKEENRETTEKKSKISLLSEKETPGAYLVSVDFIYFKGRSVASIIGTKNGEANKYVSEHTMYIKGSKIAAVESADNCRQTTIYTFNGANLKSVEFLFENAYGFSRATVNVTDKVSIEI